MHIHTGKRCASMRAHACTAPRKKQTHACTDMYIHTGKTKACVCILRGAADLIKDVRIVTPGHGRERQIRSPLIRGRRWRQLAGELCELRPRARARRLGAGLACSARTEAQALAVPWHSPRNTVPTVSPPSTPRQKNKVQTATSLSGGELRGAGRRGAEAHGQDAPRGWVVRIEHAACFQVLRDARAAGHPARAHEQGIFDPSAAACVRASFICRAGA